jgi:hypothetical protein
MHCGPRLWLSMPLLRSPPSRRLSVHNQPVKYGLDNQTPRITIRRYSLTPFWRASLFARHLRRCIRAVSTANCLSGRGARSAGLLSDVLLRQTAGDKNLRVVKAFKSGTGLARPDVFDWTEEYPAMIGTEKPDAIIVAIGANDGQGFVEDGKTLAFGSAAWVKAYQQRTADFLALLTQNGARVVWVGLPPMKSGSYNERAAEINRIAYSVVSQNPLATWWNPQPYIGDQVGGFRDLLTAPDGKTTRIRAADGIHLSDDGAALLAPALIHWINPVAQATTAQVVRPDMPPTVGRHSSRKASARIARP